MRVEDKPSMPSATSAHQWIPIGLNGAGQGHSSKGRWCGRCVSFPTRLDSVSKKMDSVLGLAPGILRREVGNKTSASGLIARCV